MLRVGLTGGIGAGKSTVARRLAELGAVVVDADVLARRAVEPGSAGLAAVVEAFGPGVLAADGALDRSALARIVFADDAARARLNAIVHPRVAEFTARAVAVAPPGAVVVYDVPLLVENGLGPAYPLVVVVDAPRDERVRRLVAARAMTPADASARIAAQAGDEARRAAADVLLDNAGAPASLLAAVDALWRDRLTPFEENLRAGRRAPRPARAVLVPPDPAWAARGERLVARVRRALGEHALRVDHIGSTAVPGLAAKDVVDVQVVVADLAAARAAGADLPAAGLVPLTGEWGDDDPDGRPRRKVFAANADPGAASNVHVRPVDSPSWREALLLRDHLRVTPDAARAYAELKQRLAAAPHASVDEYAAGKGPWLRAELARAGAWARAVGWRADPTDDRGGRRTGRDEREE